MLETNCEIYGMRYKLKYQKTHTTDGELYKGILFLKNAFGFSYKILSNKTILFDPSFTDQSRKDAIIKAIRNKEHTKEPR
jgi:hypothetical protein